MPRAPLPTRPLGTSGLDHHPRRLRRLGRGGGGWAFGWGPQDDDESLAAMRRALERGVNWIDTAAVYGLGPLRGSGRPAAAASCRRPSGRYVFTKCGLVWDERDRDGGAATRRCAPDSIRRECEASLRRLGVERIDLYQFHWPDDAGTPVEDSWAAMARLVEEGKVRAAGVSNFDVDAARALRGDPPRRLAAAAVLADPARGRRARDPLVRGARDRRHRATARCSPGLLTDRFDAARVAGAGRRTTGAAARPISDRRSSSGTSRCATRCSPIAARHGHDGRRRWRWRGRWRGRA